MRRALAGWSEDLAIEVATIAGQPLPQHVKDDYRGALLYGAIADVERLAALKKPDGEAGPAALIVAGPRRPGCGNQLPHVRRTHG